MLNARTYSNILVIIFIIIIGIFYLTTIRTGHGWGDDFSMYIAHAKNIAENKPYNDTGYIFNPQYAIVGPKTYPPIFPLLIAPIYKCFGLNFTVMKTMIIIFFLFSLILLFFIFHNTLSPFNIFSFILIIGFNPIIWDFKDNILSDIPYTFFSVVTIWFFLTYCQDREITFSQPISGIIMGLLIYSSYGTRSSGIIFLPSLFIYDYIKKRRISKLTIIATTMFFLLFALQRYLLLSNGSYLDVIDYYVPYTLVLLHNIFNYFLTITLIPWNSWPILGIPLIVSMNILIIYAFKLRIMQSITIIEIYTLLYIILIILWPIPDLWRFPIPIYAFIIFYFLYGIEYINIKKKAIKAICYSFFIIAIPSIYFLGYNEYNFSEIKKGITDSQSIDLFNYIKDHTKVDDVIIFNKPRALSLFTGRKVSCYPRILPETNDPLKKHILEFFNLQEDIKKSRSYDVYFDKLITTMKRTNAKFIVLANGDLRDPVILQNIIKNEQRIFGEVYVNQDFQIFEIKQQEIQGK